MSGADPVVLFSPTYTRHPVFHAFEPWLAFHRRETPLDDGWVKVENEHRTRCGRIEHAWGWEELLGGSWKDGTRNYQSDRRGTVLRFDQASSFGRPCRQCWPTP